MELSKSLEDGFAAFVENVVNAAIARRNPDCSYEWEWEDLAGPIADEAVRCFNIAGQQDHATPGKVRIDAGTPLRSGGLKPNPDAVLVVEFTIFGELGEGEFSARYNFTDELIRYAEVGEGGWDVARQIQQLEQTIARLRLEAERKGWPLPDVPTYSDSTDLGIVV